MRDYDSFASLEDLKIEFLDYDSGYIGDVITEIADNNIDIYYSDIIDSVRDCYDSGAYEEAINNFESSGDLMKDIQLAQYTYYSDLLYEHLDEVIEYYIKSKLEEISKDLDIEYDDEFECMLIESRMNDQNDKLENILQDIMDALIELRDEMEESNK